ncbi:AMP-binding protein [Quisquiliibacterium transsilvanicum]|uniref:Long-subunit acyl-CoA synthetase (AMP-forming) n=1 Tax=Quisquiliibacterium transsilvanicum TaxID=1549638 RepID=A0A7W8MA40_9BURK|nr:AMP-binding protein [Quisquiliibacterium transsilvanicum]MBB5273282.1 long-subunit acyl-CoA synthetase (AMP-forming) [Quisquiliibacterium transsilvanicum]
MAEPKLILEYVFDHERDHPDRVYLVQPYDGGRTVEYTWGQVVDQARRMAAHLRSAGIRDGDHIGLLSKNCAHFFIAELAIWMAGGTTVAIFPTEGPDTVRYVLEHSDAKLLFVGKLDDWPRQAPGVPEGMPRIALPLAPDTPFDRWDDIVARTKPIQGRVQRRPDDLAMIIYTSGSTGTPKGAMHAFRGVSVSAASIVASERYTPEDRLISYLPLAHVFERAFIESASFVSGSKVFFAETLDSFVQDVRRARPTLFISVPRLWVKFQHGVQHKMPQKKLDLLLKIPILNNIVRRKILDGLGLDQARLAGSGSAPIPHEVIEWYRRLGLNLMEGYAMTEDFAYSHVSRVNAHAPGYVGIPYPGVEVKISQDGEVLIKSPGQMVGYYKQPELTAESFDADGFFRTGDLGERNAQGLLKLTGRAKELFKTAKGKYVAPAPIENLLGESPLIEMSMVSGVGQPAAYALVLLSEEIRPTLGDPGVRERIERELGELLERVNAQVADYEQLKMLVVTSSPPTVENGLLTPTMKVKRAKVEASVADRLARWYAAKGPVVWD